MSAASIPWEPHTGWRFEGACAGSRASVFFPPDYQERPEERSRREMAAKSLCAFCPVRLPCREYALRMREPYGIWGGLSEGERRAMLGRQMAARHAS